MIFNLCEKTLENLWMPRNWQMEAVLAFLWERSHRLFMLKASAT
jgi:hypothetical protein